MGFKEWLKLKKTMALFGLLALVLLALVALVVVYVVNPIGESFEHVQNLFIFLKWVLMAFDTNSARTPDYLGFLVGIY